MLIFSSITYIYIYIYIYIYTSHCYIVYTYIYHIVTLLLFSSIMFAAVYHFDSIKWYDDDKDDIYAYIYMHIYIYIYIQVFCDGMCRYGLPGKWGMYILFVSIPLVSLNKIVMAYLDLFERNSSNVEKSQGPEHSLKKLAWEKFLLGKWVTFWGVNV